MSGFGFVAGVTGVFFLVGIVVGVLAVIAASALRGSTGRARRERAGDEHADPGHGADWTGTGWSGGWSDPTSAGWEEPPEPDESSQDNPAPGPPRWPGGPSGR